MSFKPSNIIYDSGYLSGATTTIDSTAIIPATYVSLEIHVLARTSEAALTGGYVMRLNNDSGTNYLRQFIRGNDSTASSLAAANATGIAVICPSATASSSIFGSAIYTIPFYTGGSHNRVVNWIDGTTSDSGSVRYANTQTARWFSNAAITRVSLIANSSSNFAVGSRMIIIGI